MTRIAKYIKPYLPLLLAAIVLLFIQAYANLSLPDYMSHIVNVGIQQGGIADAVPNALRKSQMDRLALFMSKDNAKRVIADYQLVQPGSSRSERYLSKYPALAREPIYVLREINKAEISAINPIMGKAWLVIAAIEQAGTNPAILKAMGLSGAGETAGTAEFDISSLLKKLPAERRSQIASTIDQKYASMGPKMINQAAVQPVKAEYTALGMNTANLQTTYMLHTGLIMLLLTFVAAITAISTGYLSARIASGLARDLRAAVFRCVEGFGAGEFDKFSTASLITRSTNDIMQIQMVAVMLVTMVFYAPIIGVGGIIRAINKSASMWWIIALVVAILLVAVLAVYRAAVPKFKLMQRLMDRLNLVSREALSGMMVIRAFNMQQHEENRFDDTNKDLTGTMLFVNRVMVVMMPFMFLIMNGLSVLIIWVGARQVDQSTMQVGDMIAFMQYAMQIVFAFLMLSMMFIMLPRAVVSAGRIADVLETEPLIKDPPLPESFAPGFDGTIEFNNVSFRYPGAEKDALHDISFTASPGQTTAIIGPTGAGKSTLVMLIPRFYDVNEGAIYVGGKDVRKVSQHDLRDRMGYVPQKATLFAGTIASNLRYADEQTSDQVVEDAVSISQASEFVETLPEGMEATISQGGVNVSGGQKQRLSIARALVKKPPIYIFDDSFSALDFKTDSNLRRALKKQTASSTVLVVTQRVSTIKHAERIVVLDEGQVVGRGTHRELMESCVTYREIATSQLTTEELA
jgi:ATP-binding cassette subfamily B multidrug efflux pump